MSFFNPMNWPAMLGLGQAPGPSYGAADKDRLKYYHLYRRAYDGFHVPEFGRPTEEPETTARRNRKLRCDFNHNIIELGTSFGVGGPVKWNIDPQYSLEDRMRNPGERSAAAEQAEKRAQEARTAAFDIWDRSGSDREILESWRQASIMGDIVGIAAQNSDGKPRIEFVKADICFPTFAGNDAQALKELQIVWTEETRDERRVVHKHHFDSEGVTIYENDEQVDYRATNGIAAAWIRNFPIKGESYGVSDLAKIVAMVEAYDFLMEKYEEIIAYYASPNLAVIGAKPSDTVQKDTKTVYYVPTGGDIHLIEWSGNIPAIEDQLKRLRDDIAEVSMVPAVAYGRQDSGFSYVSGVALRILYGPLIAKTAAKRASWGPALEYLMWLCLQAEGFDDIPLEAVNIQWTDALPENEKEKVEIEELAVRNRLRSRRSAMSRLGDENPQLEYDRMREEERILNLQAGLEAGLSLPVAAAEAGYAEKEVAELLRVDVVDDVTQ